MEENKLRAWGWGRDYSSCIYQCEKIQIIKRKEDMASAIIGNFQAGSTANPYNNTYNICLTDDAEDCVLLF